VIQNDLKIFHYHFQTGGVSTVVRQAVQSIRTHLSGIRSIELIAGSIPAEFRSQAARYGGKCTVVPEIGYRSPVEDPAILDRERVAAEARSLAEDLLRAFGSEDAPWWIHNHHLGKNVVFTQALLEIIHSGQPQPIILQIHDFPECGRFENLRLLKSSLSLDPYPVSPWVRYAVLNLRDRDVLIRAGIPQQSVFLLENPVLHGPAPHRRRSIERTLKELFGGEFPRYDPGAPLILYPVRTIRRKNALEALLLCLLLSEAANILITLPGVSASERGYSDLVARLFADHLCPGLWGIGSILQQRGLSFEDLVAGSDLVLSTSVQEGFGYLFINSLLWSLPLAARDLDTLGGLKDLFTEYPAYFYDTIRVPVSDGPALTEAYRSKIRGLSALIPEADREHLLAEAELMVRDGLADFSFLPLREQENLVRRIGATGGGILQSCRRENRSVVRNIERLLSTGPEAAAGAAKAAAVEGRFGAAAYAAGVRRILQSLGNRWDGSDAGSSAEIGQGVLKAFLKLENLRLLYGR
jgi:hypothetical protein